MSLEERLKNYGLRVTDTRLRVLNVISESEHAVNKKELESQFDNIDRVTLYRTLKSFEDKGLIHKIADGTGDMKYAACKNHTCKSHHHDDHVHFHCEKCSNTFCLEQVSLPKFAIPEGYQLNDVEIIAKGICDKCKSL